VPNTHAGKDKQLALKGGHMKYIIVVEPPPKKHQSTQDAYDVAAYIANCYVGDLYERGLYNSLTPTKAMNNSIRKHGVVIRCDHWSEVTQVYIRIREWIDNAGGHYKATKYKLGDVEL
jgi:hypothetical protein